MPHSAVWNTHSHSCRIDVSAAAVAAVAGPDLWSKILPRSFFVEYCCYYCCTESVLAVAVVDYNIAAGHFVDCSPVGQEQVEVAGNYCFFPFDTVGFALAAAVAAGAVHTDCSYNSWSDHLREEKRYFPGDPLDYTISYWHLLPAAVHE